MKFTNRIVLGLVAALFAVLSPGLAHGARMNQEGRGMAQVGASDARVAEIAAIYQGSADAINRELSKAIADLAATPAGERNGGAEFRAARAAELLKGVRGAVRRAGVVGFNAVSTANQDAFKRGASLAEAQARALGLNAKVAGTAASFAGINERTVDAIARDSVAKMTARMNAHGENAVALFRSLSASMAAAEVDGKGSGKVFSLSEREVNRVIAHGVVSGDPRAAMGAMRELIGKGAGFSPAVIEDYRKVGNQLVSVGGWTGKVRTYAEMVVRTRTAEAQREGQIERQVSVGLDLAQITGSNSANFCTRFVGLVVVVRGPARDGYMALSDLPGGGPPFHPNCTKNLAAYVEDLVSEGRVRQAEVAATRYAEAAARGVLMEPVRQRAA